MTKAKLSSALFVGIILFLITVELFAVTRTIVHSQTNHVVISEIQVGKTGTTTDEFVELYNPTNTSVSLDGWQLRRKTASASASTLLANLSDSIGPQGYYLVAHTNYSNATVSADIVYSTSSIAADNTLLLMDASSSVPIDKVGFGAAGDKETSGTVNPPNGKSIERKATVGSTSDSMKTGGSDSVLGNGEDTDNNGNDFLVRDIPDPQNSSSAPEPTLLTPTPVVTPTLTPEPTTTPTPTEIPEPTVTPTTTPTVTPTMTPTDIPTYTPTPTPIPTVTPTPTELPTPTVTPSQTPTVTVTPTETPIPTMTPTPTVTPTEIPTSTPIPTETSEPTFTPTPTVSLIPTELPTPTNSPSPTPTVTPTPTIAPTPTVIVVNPTSTVKPTRIPTPTPKPKDDHKKEHEFWMYRYWHDHIYCKISIHEYFKKGKYSVKIPQWRCDYKKKDDRR